jgi:hypothetical protein
VRMPQSEASATGFTAMRLDQSVAVLVLHYESATRGSAYDFMDRALLLDEWGSTIANGDPCCRWEPASCAKVQAA